MKGTRSLALILFAVVVCLAGAGARVLWRTPVARLELPPVERVVVEHTESVLPTESTPTDESESETTPAVGLPREAEGLAALDVQIDLLRQGLDGLVARPDHAARFHRQVRVDGLLLDPEVVELAVRHEPFSVHMEWVNGDEGRRAVYVEGENEGRMLVRLGGWKARLPPLRLDPLGTTAMRSSRHPITSAGLVALTSRLLANREEDLEVGDGLRCRFARDVSWDGRACHEFVVEYATRSSAPSAETYRKSVQYLDRETRLPILVRNYGWPPGDEPVPPDVPDDETLLEEYGFSNVRFDVGHTDETFDVTRRSKAR